MYQYSQYNNYLIYKRSGLVRKNSMEITDVVLNNCVCFKNTTILSLLLEKCKKSVVTNIVFDNVLLYINDIFTIQYIFKKYNINVLGIDLKVVNILIKNNISKDLLQFLIENGIQFNNKSLIAAIDSKNEENLIMIYQIYKHISSNIIQHAIEQKVGIELFKYIDILDMYYKKKEINIENIFKETLAMLPK
jgi:hypothetical protein